MTLSGEALMRRAVAISAESMRAGNGGPFGAVIAKEGRIVAEGFNRVTSTNDPTAHAEIVAIREACRALDVFGLQGCEIYTSCEPCPMCLGAIYWARLDCVYYANTRTDAAAIGFDDDFIYREFGKDLPERAMPFVRLDIREARTIFDEWLSKVDRIPY